MQFLNTLIDRLTTVIRLSMRHIARGLNTLTGGKLNPHAVTFVSLSGHVPVAFLVAARHPEWAGLLLLAFGLLDSLDGELARVQAKDGPAGMLLDSVADRMKEVILYIGVGWGLLATNQGYAAIWAVAACGSSLLVSYINAWGEVVITSRQLTHTTNQVFRGGLMRYQVRMLVLLIGLLSGYLVWAVAVITVLSWLTAIDRLLTINRRLQDVQS